MTVAVQTFPIVEVFGPVVQGEGPVAGQVTHFIRLGLCDYRCSWCDSMFAVEPAEVKANAAQMTAAELVEELGQLAPAPWLTLSGGNPAIHDLTELVDDVHLSTGMEVCVETQASKWADWLPAVDMLVASPKPPSSGMVSAKHAQETERFMANAEVHLDTHRRAIKIVVFDQTDLDWAEAFICDNRGWTAYLSVGTDPPTQGEPISTTRQKVCERYRWLCEMAPGLACEVTVFPQLHVLAYGHARGV